MHTLSEAKSSGVQGVVSSVDPMNQATDTWSSVLSDVISKLGAFTEVVDKIAEVHPYAKIAWMILSAIPKVCHAVSFGVTVVV
ncbi:hypothetical protein OF83DRAFT_1176875 [Amylostereum chailletii]|nr:hypothetical protein OF83DRAFT_1176875 [Amylostereum chailletii]